MGYEETRFIDAIDEEFYCSICTMILKEPTQSPCEHFFCSECIKGWLAVDQSCPIERRPLKLEDLKPALRTIRNVMNKFLIKCDFELKGCASIVKLVNLEDHVATCEYRPNATVVWDKSESKEFQGHNDELNLRRDKTTKLNDEICTYRSPAVIQQFQNEIIPKKKQIPKLCSERLEFRVWGTMNISTDHPNELVVDYGFGYAQSVYSLTQTQFSFKIEVLNLGKYIGIGSAPMCPSDRKPSFADGTLFDGKFENSGLDWNVGDIIECGINFSSDFFNNYRCVVRHYFIKNGELIRENVVISIDGLFPTVCLSEGSKIRYLNN